MKCRHPRHLVREMRIGGIVAHEKLEWCSECGAICRDKYKVSTGYRRKWTRPRKAEQ